MNYGKLFHTHIGAQFSQEITIGTNIDWILDGGYLPQSILRVGIRSQLKDRLVTIGKQTLEEKTSDKQEYIAKLRKQPIAVSTDTANTQHYEVGTGVLAACLGPRMKYSCCPLPNRQRDSSPS